MRAHTCTCTGRGGHSREGSGPVGSQPSALTQQLLQSFKCPGRLFSLERKVLESPCSRPAPIQLWKVREKTEKLPEGCMARPGSSVHAGRNAAPPMGDKPPSLHPAQGLDPGVLTVWMWQSLGIRLQWTWGQDDHNETVLQQGSQGPARLGLCLVSTLHLLMGAPVLQSPT